MWQDNLKYKLQCPTLKVHDQDMKTVKSQRYLGDIISSSGTYKDCVEDRRNKGWGKVAEIAGILSEMPSTRKVEIGLKMREAKLLNSMIFSTEEWSSISNGEMTRLEQVDMSLLRSLVEGHSKCSRAFILMEFGVLEIRHRITIRRLMFHHHLVTRDSNELIFKVWQKQKEDSLKGDWYQTLEKDFQFISEEIDDEKIRKNLKYMYKKYIKLEVEQAAFQPYLEAKERSKNKMHLLQYKTLGFQCYLTDNSFSHNEFKLLFSLRSNCYSVETNFRKMNKGYLQCIFKCDKNKTQIHVFENCQPIEKKLNCRSKTSVGT